MDQVQEALEKAIELQKDSKTKPSAYYQYLQVAWAGIQLLSKEHFFAITPRDCLDRETVQAVLKMCTTAVDSASNLLGSVLDLSESEAIKASVKPVQIPMAATISSQLPPSNNYQSSPSRSAQEMVDSNLPGAYGPDIPIKDERSAVPLIPTSILNLGFCKQMYELQMQVQKAQNTFCAPPKKQANAIYLNNLHGMLQKMSKAALNKSDIAKSMNIISQTKILHINPTDIARQLTLVAFSLFSRIPLQQFQITQTRIDQGSTEEDALFDDASSTADLDAFYSFELYITQWAQYEILRYARSQDRALVIGLFIKSLRHLVDLGSMAMAGAIVKALQASAIARLGESWALVPRKLQVQKESMDLLFAKDRSWAQVKEAHRKRATAVCIPYLHMTLPSTASAGNNILGIPIETLKRWQKSVYGRMVTAKYVVQHYILIQPFRWDMELFELSRLREARSGKSPNSLRNMDGSTGEEDLDSRLTDLELERINSPHDDAFDVIRMQIEAHNTSALSPASIPNNISNHSAALGAEIQRPSSPAPTTTSSSILQLQQPIHGV